MDLSIDTVVLCVENGNGITEIALSVYQANQLKEFVKKMNTEQRLYSSGTSYIEDND